MHILSKDVQRIQDKVVVIIFNKRNDEPLFTFLRI